MWLVASEYFVENYELVEPCAQSQATDDVIAERERQIKEEGWTSEHDDEHDAGELCGAGAAYALYTSCALHPIGDAFGQDDIPPGWCWDYRWWKPTTPRRNLVKAAALIIAEIEKIDRANP